TNRTVMRAVRFCPRTKAYATWPPSNYSGGAQFKMLTAANSAGDPLDPPVEVPVSEWSIRVSKNVPTVPSWFLTYANAVNIADQVISINGTDFTIPAGCGRLGNLSFTEPQQENGTDFVTLNWECLVGVPRDPIDGESSVPSPWDTERLDEGMRVPVGA